MISQLVQLDQYVFCLCRAHAHNVMGVGDAAEKIVDYVVDNNIDLVVMSAHGRTGLARWAYGSVARKVLDAVPCSVFLVRNVGTPA